MSRVMSRRPSPALVIALIALVASTAGVGYAASKINGSKIKKESIAGNRLKPKTIKSKQVADGAIKGRNLAAGVITPAAFAAQNTGAITVGDGVSNFVTVAEVTNLPGGDYAISGKAEVEPNPLAGNDTAQVICALFVDGSEVDRSRLQVGENAAASPVVLRGTIPVQAVAGVPDGADVGLSCSRGGAGVSVDASQRSLTAIAVELQP